MNEYNLSLKRTTSDTMGHKGKSKFNEKCSLQRESGEKLREVKINLAHFSVSSVPWLSYRAFKESWTDFRQDVEKIFIPDWSHGRSFLKRDRVHYLTQHWDVIHMIVICQGSHESVAETRLATPHGALVLLASGEPHHGHGDELAGAPDSSRVPAPESESPWNGNR